MLLEVLQGFFRLRAKLTVRAVVGQFIAQLHQCFLQCFHVRTLHSNGVQIIKGGNKPPYVAIGFACTLDDDSKELWWLYKGTFSEPTKTAKTDADAIEYQTPTIEGVFIRRMNDDALAAVVDTAAEGIGTGVEAGWFTEVYEETEAA